MTQGLQAADALARPGCVPCALWRVRVHAWARLGVAGLARAGSVLVKGVHELLQESERDVQDTTVQARSER